MRDHGPAMFQHAVGGVRGIAKKAKITIVRWPLKQGGPTPRILNPASIVEHRTHKAYTAALDLIIEDVIAKGLQGRAVSNPSFGGNVLSLWGFRLTRLYDTWRRRYQALETLGVVLVNSAGNEARTSPNMPGLYALKEVPSMIVIYAVDSLGKTRIRSSSRGRPFKYPKTISVAAPGVDISTDFGLISYPDGLVDGSSSATAFTSSLAAVFLAQT